MKPAVPACCDLGVAHSLLLPLLLLLLLLLLLANKPADFNSNLLSYIYKRVFLVVGVSLLLCCTKVRCFNFMLLYHAIPYHAAYYCNLGSLDTLTVLQVTSHLENRHFSTGRMVASGKSNC